MSPELHTGVRRTAWMAARARNAAKRGGLIAFVGFLAVCSTLLLLVLVPREVNRGVRARIDALPPLADTIPLLSNFTGALDRLKNAEANLHALRVADADRIASATAGSSVTVVDRATGTVTDVGEQGDFRKELTLRVARARAAPLVENFRALGEADMLASDTRARVLLDSLNEVNRDREAYAALGGPDARYAAMTTRLSALGQRLLVIAEQRLGTQAGGLAPTPSAPVTVATAATTTTAATVATAATAGGDSAQRLPDSTTLAPAQRYSGDSLADQAARDALDSAKVKLQEAELALRSAQASNVRIAAERASAEAASPARVPPVAMLIAALVIGLALGYSVAFYVEVKHPRVADVAEVERMTDTRVITHDGRARPPRRRPGEVALPRVVDLASEAYQLLHVTLTGFGDTSRGVQVMSNDSVLGATVGINLAAAAARDSRATLLVDANATARPVDRLLQGRKKFRTVPAPGANDKTPPLQVMRTSVGPELFLDTLVLDPQHDVQELVRLSREHDFMVTVQPERALPDRHSILSPTDVILCARVGATRLEWLAERTLQLRERNYRVRAVLLWTARAPSAR